MGELDELDDILTDFLNESEESLDKLDPLFLELEARGHDKDILHEIFRSMHTIKGAAGFLGFQAVVDIAHRAENILKKLRENEISISRGIIDVVFKSVDMLKLHLRHIRLKDGVTEDVAGLLKELDSALNAPVKAAGTEVEMAEGPAQISCEAAGGNAAAAPPAPVQEEKSTATEPATPKDLAQTTLRIDVDRVDKVMDLTGEIVLVRNRLLNIANYLENKFPGEGAVENLIGTVSFLDLVASDMQLAVMKMRMQPLKKVFSKFPRLVRDISKALGKEIELEISGEATEVDRSVIEQIGDPMIHIIRNSIGHGIEQSAERLRKGKSPTGRIRISASQQGNHIVIEVSDDGNGIDAEAVKKKAREKGIIRDEEAQRMTDDAAINLIFLPGFSTAETTTELSGRGVGMDVVKTNIAKLNGYVEIATEKDAGTTFRISIPLTLAIIQALMVRIDGQQYAIPLSPVVETLKISRDRVEMIAGQSVIVVRGKVLPLFELSEILGTGARKTAEEAYVIVIAIGERQFCIAVDELLGQEEAVIKTVEGVDTNSSCIVGATIDGSGRVVLILDLSGISRNVLGLIKV